MNLFERLTSYDKKIDSYLNTIEDQLNDLTNHNWFSIYKAQLKKYNTEVKNSTSN
jgi:hypothetical protein